MTMRPRSFDDGAALTEAVSDLLRRFDALRDPAPSAVSAAVVGVSGEPAYLVAASDALTETKAVAHFQCSGASDEVEIQAALDALPDNSVEWDPGADYRYAGVVRLSEGLFNLGGDITVSRGQALLGSGMFATVLRVSSGVEILLAAGANQIEIGNFAVTELIPEGG